MSSKPYYEENPIINDPSVNVLFEDLLNMSNSEFEDWVRHCRSKFIEYWNKGCPPKNGKSEEHIIQEFNKLSDIDVLGIFTKDDELSADKGTVIQNNLYTGSEVDQFFPNMMKTKFSSGKNNRNALSMFDIISNDKYLPRMIKSSFRHFKRDSFYHYSLCAKKNNSKVSLFECENAVEWMHAFHRIGFPNYSFWIEESEKSEDISSSYRQVRQSEFLSLTKDEIVMLLGSNPEYFPHSTISNIDVTNLKSNCVYHIRVYKLGQRIYPKGFVAYRIGYLSNAVNFPPLTAKYIYEKYTKHLKGETINVYDPSSGWAGRILGAMCVADDRKIHYIGTDPNPENIHSDGRTKYEHVADFFNTRTYRGNSPFSSTNTYEIFREGSECIDKNINFQKYKGKVDLVFTSPPYFNKEIYSLDSNQSCVKYTTYEDWKYGFLIPTLKICYDYLKPNGYIIWNIADILVDGKYLPLEQDSKQFLESLGMTYIETLKMSLQLMSGAQRVDENGIPKCKNYCKVNGKYLKYEPIMVFKK